jgi:hypothetical protein
MPTDFAAALKQAEEQGLVGKGDYLKLREGDNKLRLMSECLPHANEFQGQRNFKWLCYVLDRKDGKVKPFFMAHTIYKQIVALQTNEEYAFDDVPMPYDLTINAIGAGTKEVKYTLMPARKNTPVTEAEKKQLAEQKPLKELQAKLKEKQSKPAAPPPADDHDIEFDPNDLDEYGS